MTKLSGCGRCPLLAVDDRYGPMLGHVGGTAGEDEPGFDLAPMFTAISPPATPEKSAMVEAVEK